MKTLPAGLASHVAGAVTTLCACWAVHRTDGVALGFTDHDKAIGFDGISFEPRSGFTASEAETSTGLSVDGFDVDGALDSERLTKADIEAGLYDGARVDVFAVNWTTPRERVLMRSARIGQIVRQGDAFRAELMSGSAEFDKPRGRLFERNCDAALGDVRCGKDISAPPFRVTAAVTGVHADGIGIGGAGEFASGWFSLGTVSWTGPGGAASSARIEDHVKQGTAVRLRLRLGAPVPPVGTTVTLTAGCDKRFATCRDKFANSENFRGFPHLPGNDAAYAYAAEGLDFDGGPLVR